MEDDAPEHPTWEVTLMTVTNAFARFIVCPLIVALSDVLLAGVQYAGWTHWIFVGLILAVASLVMDMTVLDRAGHIGGFILDTLAATVIVYLSQYILPGAIVTWGGALGAGILLGLAEIGMHAWLQASRRAGMRRSRP
jgi:hypothetical protein